MSAGTCESCRGITGRLRRVILLIDEETRSWELCHKCVWHLTADFRRFMRW